jgi:hypothetical protein
MPNSMNSNARRERRGKGTTIRVLPWYATKSGNVANAGRINLYLHLKSNTSSINPRNNMKQHENRPALYSNDTFSCKNTCKRHTDTTKVTPGTIPRDSGLNVNYRRKYMSIFLPASPLFKSLPLRPFLRVINFTLGIKVIVVKYATRETNKVMVSGY